MAVARLLPRPNLRTVHGSAPGGAQVIVLANQKGGVAKTTTTLNLGVAFAEQGLKVLLVDLDPQGNLTMSQGLNPDSIERSMFDVLVNRLPIEHVIEAREVDIAVSSIDLEVGDVVSGSGSGGSGSGSSSLSNADSSSTSSSAVTVTSTNKYVVDATVSADEATQVKKGMQAQVTATGSTATIYGTVASVGLVAQTSSSGAAVFPVTIAVTGAQKGLYAGTSATASIIVKQVENVLTVSSRAIQSSGGSTYVLKVVNGKAVKTPVKIGTVYGASTQILSGLSSGDTVQIPGITLPSGASTGNRTTTRNGSGSGFGSFGGGSGSFPSGGFGGGTGGGGFPGGGQ